MGGIIAGAVGAHELERGYEKRREKKNRLEDPYAEGQRPSNHRRRSSGAGLIGGMKEKVEGLLNPDSAGKEKRRSKSHVSSYSERRRGDYSDEEFEGRYEGRGGRRGRDDYY